MIGSARLGRTLVPFPLWEPLDFDRIEYRRPQKKTDEHRSWLPLPALPWRILKPGGKGIGCSDLYVRRGCPSLLCYYVVRE